MKSGETALIAFRVKNIDIASVDAVIFTLKGASFITKNYPSDDVTYSDGRFVVALYQEDTIALGNGKRVLVEAQINSGDKSVIKSKYVVIDDKSTIATQILDGNTPTAYRLADIDLEFDSQFVVATIDEETVDEAVARAVNAAMQAENAVVAAQEATAGANNARDNANAAATEAVSIANNAASHAVTTANNAAQTAMNTATTAANNANSAAVEARQAKTEAIDAKTRADEATAKANAATTSATNAAGLANTAAGTANTAASNADTARANAVTATSAANSAASAANTAAGKANTAASNADTKASLANEKAELAATKAGEADAAAIRANEAADTVDAKIRESLAGVNRELNAQSNRITNLEYASKGVLFREESDGATAYTKSVPSGALPYGTLDMIGGMSQVVEGEIVTAEPKSVESVGANLLNPSNVIKGRYITVTGAFVMGSYDMFFCAIEKGKKYTISTDDAGYVYGFYYEMPTLSSITYNNSRTVDTVGVFTAPIDGYVAFRTQKDYDKAMLQIGETRTPYAPYVGTIEQKSLPTSLPTLLGINDTVYDYIEFEPVTYRNMKSVDLGSLEWSYRTSDGLFYSYGVNASAVFPSTDNVRANILCNGFTTTDRNSVASADKMIALSSASTKVIFVNNKEYTDVASFTRAMQGIILHYEATEGGEDYEAKLLHRKCAKARGLTWVYSDGEFYSRGIASSAKYSAANSVKGNIMSNRYTNVPRLSITDKTIAIANNGVLWLSDSSLSASDTPDVEVIYELATEQILDVTDLLAEWENSIHVEGGGTITFAQDGLHIPVPNSETYLVKVEV